MTLDSNNMSRVRLNHWHKMMSIEQFSHSQGDISDHGIASIKGEGPLMNLGIVEFCSGAHHDRYPCKPMPFA
jgi:hypothetical protein